MIHLNVVDSATWATKQGEGKDNDYANWRIFKPNSNQIKRINSLIINEKFNTDAFSDNVLGEVFQKKRETIRQRLRHNV